MTNNPDILVILETATGPERQIINPTENHKFIHNDCQGQEPRMYLGKGVALLCRNNISIQKTCLQLNNENCIITILRNKETDLNIIMIGFHLKIDQKVGKDM